MTGPPGAGEDDDVEALGATFPTTVHLHTDDFWRYIDRVMATLRCRVQFIVWCARAATFTSPPSRAALDTGRLGPG